VIGLREPNWKDVVDKGRSIMGEVIMEEVVMGKKGVG
jgi:hypothetical protein